MNEVIQECEKLFVFICIFQNGIPKNVFKNIFGIKTRIWLTTDQNLDVSKIFQQFTFVGTVILKND